MLGWHQTYSGRKAASIVRLRHAVAGISRGFFRLLKYITYNHHNRRSIWLCECRDAAIRKNARKRIIRKLENGINLIYKNIGSIDANRSIGLIKFSFSLLLLP